MTSFAQTKIQIELELGKGSGLSIINLFEGLLLHAHAAGSSDVHIDPGPEAVRIRLRVDGILLEAFTFPKSIYLEIISRIKILSGLRTDEHQAAQDGRFRFQTGSAGPVDVRVSIAPTYYGENAVLRLLVDKEEYFTLESLGFSHSNREKVMQAIRKPFGMVLTTGPTGSGKTTTLYTILKIINTPEVSVVTIEDPIEYAIAGVEQIQVNPRTGLSFAQGLRSILRQDPDIIMVGEIRDSETAGIAINVALTGHLLLSTLHTNDPATTLPRLLDMKIEPYLVASTVNLVIGQRLVRKICGRCKTAARLTNSQLAGLQDAAKKYITAETEIFSGSGCEACNLSGFSGRVALHEVLVVTDAVREAIFKKATAAEITGIAKTGGMTTMMEDGWQKVLLGLTTIEELLRLHYE